jgi:HSP20 family protein
MLWSDPFAPFLTQLTRGAAFTPAADVLVRDGDMLLSMDVPGLTADDLEIEFVDGYLTVRGERRRPDVDEGTQWMHTERAFGRFERAIALPEGVDPEGITATVDNGVLSLTVPKPSRLQPKTIAIGGEREQRQLAGAAA